MGTSVLYQGRLPTPAPPKVQNPWQQTPVQAPRAPSAPRPGPSIPQPGIEAPAPQYRQPLPPMPAGPAPAPAPAQAPAAAAPAPTTAEPQSPAMNGLMSAAGFGGLGEIAEGYAEMGDNPINTRLGTRMLPDSVRVLSQLAKVY